MGQRLIPRTLQDDTASVNMALVRIFFLFCLRHDFLINVYPALMPDNFIRIGTEQKPCRIQGIIIKKRIHPPDCPLERRIILRIPRPLYLEIDMELRPRRLSVFFLHVAAARHRRVIHFLKKFLQFPKGDPVLRILRVVIIAVHHHHIRPDEIADIPVILLKFTAHMVKPRRCLQPIPG